MVVLFNVIFSSFSFSSCFCSLFANRLSSDALCSFSSLCIGVLLRYGTWSPILEVWDSSVAFISPWALQLQQLIFVLWFSQGSYQVLGCRTRQIQNIIGLLPQSSNMESSHISRVPAALITLNK